MKGYHAAFAAAAIVGVYAVCAPREQTVNPVGERGPNPVQQEFVRLVAHNYDYVALGDTNHREPRIAMFATHSDMVGALEMGGKKRLFLEAGPKMQSYFDALSVGEATALKKSDANMWLCGTNVKRAYNEEFERSLHNNPLIKFTGVDQRHAEGSEASRYLDSPLFKWSVTKPVSFYEKIYGCVGDAALIPGAIVLGLFSSFDILRDDRDTAAQILSYPEQAGAIVYGADHYEKIDNTMRTLLEDAGRSVAHVNIYLSDRTNVKKGQLSSMGAYLLVNEEGSDGIVALTPELEKLRLQALENIRQRKDIPAAPQI